MTSSIERQAKEQVFLQEKRLDNPAKYDTLAARVERLEKDDISGQLEGLEEMTIERIQRVEGEIELKMRAFKNDLASLIASFDKLRHDVCFTKAYMEKIDNIENQLSKTSKKR